jgi:hypothetical protein
MKGCTTMKLDIRPSPTAVCGEASTPRLARRLAQGSAPGSTQTSPQGSAR